MQAGIQFDWRGEICGAPDGAVRFAFHGEAKSAFLKNRIGLCVLHPIQECAGQRCTVEHSDGSTTDRMFPNWISPDQPFKNIRSMTHNASSDVRVRIAFSGEVFETEDQRNWTDASFKTYCTPLDIPFPVQVSQGEQFDQSVTIELCDEDCNSIVAFRGANGDNDSCERYVDVDWTRLQPLPPIGLSMATCSELPSAAAIERLHAIRPSHLRVDLILDSDDWEERYRKALALATQIDTKLEVALFATNVDDLEAKRCRERLQAGCDRIARWLVFHTTDKATPDSLATAFEKSLREIASKVPVVVGTNAYFAELNRHRPRPLDSRLVCYSINPQVHAFDNRSLCETLEVQAWTVDSAREIFGTSVVVSPITLRPRFNPNATSTREGSSVAEPESDARQTTNFLAAWTVGAMAQLATHPSVASLTFFETFGPRGIMSSRGEAYPVASVFDAIQGNSSIGQSTSTCPWTVASLAVQREDGRRVLLLANLSDQRQTVRVRESGLSEQRWTLDAETIRLETWGNRR